MPYVDLGTLAVGIGGDLRELQRVHREANRYIGDIDRNLKGLKQTSARIFGGIGVGVMANEARKAADEYKLLGSRLGLATNGTQDLEYAQRRLFEVAQETRQSLGATMEIFARVGRSREELGRSTEELVKFTEQLNKLTAISGAGPEEARNALVQLSQGLASGELRGEELRSVMEQIPAVSQAIAKSLGVTTGEFRRMAHEGEITADIVIESILQMEAETNAAFDQIEKTSGQAWTQVKNAAVKAIGEMDAEIGATAGLAEGLTTIANNMDKIASGATLAGGAIAGVFVARGLRSAKEGIIELNRSTREHIIQQNRAIEAERAAAQAMLQTTQARQREAAATAASETATLRKMKAELASGEIARHRVQMDYVIVESELRKQQAIIKTNEQRMQELRMQGMLEQDGRRMRSITTQLTQAEQARAAAKARLIQLMQQQRIVEAQLAAGPTLSAAERRGAVGAIQTQGIVAADARKASKAATEAYTKAQEAATRQTKALTRASVGLGSALNLIGGPAGAALIAGWGVNWLVGQYDKATKEMEAFQDEQDRIFNAWMSRMGRIDSMSGEQLAPTMIQEDIQKEIDATLQLIDEYEKKVSAFYQQRASSSRFGGQFGAEIFDKEAFRAAKQELERLYNELNIKQKNLENAPATSDDLVKNLTGSMKIESDHLNDIFDTYKQRNRELELTLSGQEDQIVYLQAEQELQEAILRVKEEKGLSEEEQTALYNQQLPLIQRMVAEYLRLTKAAKETTEYENQRKAIWEKTKGMELDLAQARNVLTLGEDRAEIENRILQLKHDHATITDEEIARIRKLLQEQQAVEQAVEAQKNAAEKLRETFQGILDDMDKARKEEEQRQKSIQDYIGGLELEIEMARNRLTLTKEQAAVENQILQLQAQYGEISPVQLAFIRAKIKLLQVLEGQLEGSSQKLDVWKERAQRTAEAASGGFEDAFGSFFNDTFKGQLDSAEQYFYRFTDAIISEWSRMMAEIAAQKAMKGLGLSKNDEGIWTATGKGLLKVFGWDAAFMEKGGVVDRPYMAASGMIVDQPTLLGRKTIAGEAGPEAVLPLRRGRGGNLGIMATMPEPGGVVINIIDQTQGEHEYATSERRDQNGQRMIDVVIKTKVKEAFANGEMDGIMKSNYGVMRQGWGSR